MKILDTYGTFRDFAVLAQDCAKNCEILTRLDAMKIPDDEIPFLLPLSDTHPRRTWIRHISFDPGECVPMAMEYIPDDRITAQEPFLRFPDPVFKLLLQCKSSNFQIANTQ